MILQKNMGLADRVIRPALASAIIGAYTSGKLKHATAGKILLGVAGMFMLTSALGSCPLYQALGLSTKSR
jgi:hypothetical protein